MYIPDKAYSACMLIAAGNGIHRQLLEIGDRSADHPPQYSTSMEDLATWWGNQSTSHRLRYVVFYSLLYASTHKKIWQFKISKQSRQQLIRTVRSQVTRPSTSHNKHQTVAFMFPKTNTSSMSLTLSDLNYFLQLHTHAIHYDLMQCKNIMQTAAYTRDANFWKSKFLMNALDFLIPPHRPFIEQCTLLNAE